MTRPNQSTALERCANVFAWFCIALLACFTLAVVLTSCTDQAGSRRVLEEQNFQRIKMTGYDVFGCSEDDDIHDGFTAEARDGTPIRGVVCCGYWAKGCTVRVYP